MTPTVLHLLLACAPEEAARPRWAPPEDADGADTGIDQLECVTEMDGELAEVASAILCGEGTDMVGWAVDARGAAEPGGAHVVVAAPQRSTEPVLAWDGAPVSRLAYGDASAAWSPSTGSYRGNAVRLLDDLDGDGLPELASTAVDANDPSLGVLTVWPGAGGEPRLTFAPEAPGAGGTLAGGDVDLTGDGEPDLVARSAGCGKAIDAWIVTAGAMGPDIGALRVTRTVVNQATGPLLRGAAALSDIDGDGATDLALACDLFPGAIVLGGPFTEDRSLDDADLHIGPDRGGGGTWVETLAGGVDLDDDGLEDLALATEGGVLIATASGATVLDLTRGEPAGALALPGDVDGDGFPDMIVGRPWGDDDTSGVTVAHGPFSGGGSARTRVFEAPADRLAGMDVAGADLDGDDLADLVVGVPGGDGYAGLLYVVYGSALVE